MIIFVYGEDTYRSRAYVHELIDKFKRERDPSGFNCSVFTAGAIENDAFVGAATASPFMAERRMIVIYNPLSLPADELETYHDVLSKLPEHTIAVIAQTDAIGKTKLAKEWQKELAAQKYSREFAPLPPAERERFLQKYAKEKGADISPVVAAKVAQSGSDLWSQTAIVEQLMAYGAGREIAPADVDLFATSGPSESVFALAEAVVTGNVKVALSLLSAARASGDDDPHKLIGLIAWQLRTLAAVAGSLEEDDGETSDSIARRLKLHPFVVKKNMALARRVPLAAIGQRISRLTELDRAIKTGGGDADVLLDRFVLQS